MRTIAILFSISVCLLAPASARAECINPGRWSLDQPYTELVFSGTVVGINQVADQGVRLTFNVDRVWKGSVPKRFNLYVSQLDAEMPTIEFARRYLVVATTMNVRSRQSVGLPDIGPPVFRPVDCGALDYGFAERAGTIRNLGDGQPPK